MTTPKLAKVIRYLLIGFLPTALICAVFLFLCPLTSSIYYPQDKAAIAARYNQIYLAMTQQDYKTAYYCCMSPEYRNMHSLEEFEEDHWWFHEDFALNAKHLITFSGSRATLYSNHYEFFEPLYAGPACELVKVDGEWYFTGESTFYYD